MYPSSVGKVRSASGSGQRVRTVFVIPGGSTDTVGRCRTKSVPLSSTLTFAGAVRCFVLDEPEPLIDTNTVRVIGRLFGLEIKDSSRRNALFKRVIADMVDPVEPRLYNYALLDLAALVCTRALPPACSECPVRKYCLYGTDPAMDKRS